MSDNDPAATTTPSVDKTPPPAVGPGIATETLDVPHTRLRFTPLRDAFLYECAEEGLKDTSNTESSEDKSRDFISLHRVTSSVLRPLIYMGARIELDFLLRSLSSEFLPSLLSSISSTPPYYPPPSSPTAWTTTFPTLESKQSIDERYCAFHIVSIMADTCPAILRRLVSGEESVGVMSGLLRLMFNMYARAVNPLDVEDGAAVEGGGHEHITKGSEEPRVWKPQWRAIVSFLVLLGVQPSSSTTPSPLQNAYQSISSETQAGASKLKVHNASLEEIFLSTISEYESKSKSSEKLDEEDTRLLSDFSKFLSIVIGDDTKEKEERKEMIRVDLESGRDTRVACAGCGKVVGSEKELMACGQCLVMMYCSTECQTMDWKRYHKETCKYPVAV